MRPIPVVENCVPVSPVSCAWIAFSVGFVDGHAKAIQAQDTGLTGTQFSTTGIGRTIRLYRIGANGGFYAGRIDCLGIPQ